MNKRQQELLAEFLRLSSRYSDQDFAVVLRALQEGRAAVEAAEMVQTLSRTVQAGTRGAGGKRPSDREREVLETVRAALDTRPVAEVRSIAHALGLGYEKGEKKPRLVRRVARRLAELPQKEFRKLVESFQTPSGDSSFQELAKAIMGTGKPGRGT